MALSKTLELQDSFGENRTFERAYIKVTKLSGNKDMMQVVYTAFKAKDSNKLKDYQTGFSPSLDGDNFIKQAYEHLKTDVLTNTEDV